MESYLLTDNDRGSKFHIKSGSWLSADMFIDCKETQVIMDGEVQKPYASDNNSFGGDVFADEIIVKYTYETISNPCGRRYQIFIYHLLENSYSGEYLEDSW